MKTYRKGVDERIRIDVDWRLNSNETIETSVFTGDLTEVAKEIVGHRTSIVLSGGVLNTTYTVENQITTDYGDLDQTLEKSFKVMVVDK